MQHKPRRLGPLIVPVLLVAICARAAGAALGADEIIKQHLQSLGSPEARTAKSRVVEGSAIYKLLVGGSGQIQGKAVLVSEKQKLHLLLKVNANEYRGEQFICDGERTNVAGTYADKTRSEFGEFVRTQDVMLREGLLGGVLSTAWPMLDADVRKAKVNYEGEKRVENRQLQVLRYRPKKATDLIIFLYFDPETFRHVMTSYELTIRPTVVSEIKNARQQEIRYRIEERFGDFKVVDGLTLPSHYDLRFTEELQNGFTKSLEWDVTTTRVLNNVSLDPRNFQF